jgi:O-antigen/teichoic acid export membrane protein
MKLIIAVAGQINKASASGTAQMLSIKTIRGAGWSVSSRLGGRVIDVVTVLILARTLTPADFGLTALAMTLIAVVDTVLEVPLIHALTRLKDIDRSHLDTAFTLGALRGLLLALIVLGAAWPFSVVFHDSRLAVLVAVLALGPVARSLYSPGMVTFIRQMSFRQAFIAEFAGKIIASALAISLVYLGGGYWAIAASSIASSVATVLMSYLLAPYRPALSLAKLADFSTFLGWFSSAQVISAVSWQFDRVLLGYFVTKSELGQYTMASDLSVLPTQSLIGPAMQPVMAAFSRINHDRVRLQNAYLKASRFTMMLAAPACIGIALTSDLIADVLLGPKWKEAAVLLQWMALATVLSAYYQPLYSLALAVNRPLIIFRLTLIEFCSRVVLISLGLYYFSIMGAVAARGAVSVIMFMATLFTAKSLAGVSIAVEIRNLWRAAGSCLIMALFVLLLRHQLDGIHVKTLIELIFVAAFGAGVYATALFVLGVRLRKPAEIG